MLLACLLRVEAVSKKYNIKEGIGMGACDDLVLGGGGLSCVYLNSLCNEVFWNKLCDVS